MSIPNNWCVEANDVLYFGGTAPVTADGQIVGPGDVSMQTERIFTRFDEKLRSQGLGLEHIVFITVYLLDLKDYASMNAVYAQMLPEPYPARKVIQAPMTIDGMRVEMTAIACRKPKRVL